MEASARGFKREVLVGVDRCCHGHFGNRVSIRAFN